jgi:hypothetical protein
VTAAEALSCSHCWCAKSSSIRGIGSGKLTDEHQQLHPEREITMYQNQISEIRTELVKANDTIMQKNAETSQLQQENLQLRLQLARACQ